MSKKIEKIENLSINELKNCLINLINRLGYSNIEIHNDYIYSILNRPLGKDKHVFILFNEILSGNVDEQEILKNILISQKEFKANSYYIVSNNNISKGFISKISGLFDNQTLSFIGRDELIELIDSNYEDFWKHEDLSLIEYEKLYSITTTQDSELKKLKIFNDKYQKLLDIFIEPRIYYTYEEKSSKTPVRKKIDIEYLINNKANQIITGDAGTGKTTLLKKIGEELIKRNSTSDKRNLPIFLSSTEIFENNFNINNLISKKISAHFKVL